MAPPTTPCQMRWLCLKLRTPHQNIISLSSSYLWGLENLLLRWSQITTEKMLSWNPGKKFSSRRTLFKVKDLYRLLKVNSQGIAETRLLLSLLHLESEKGNRETSEWKRKRLEHLSFTKSLSRTSKISREFVLRKIMISFVKPDFMKKPGETMNRCKGSTWRLKSSPTQCLSLQLIWKGNSIKQ